MDLFPAHIVLSGRKRPISEFIASADGKWESEYLENTEEREESRKAGGIEKYRTAEAIEEGAKRGESGEPVNGAREEEWRAFLREWYDPANVIKVKTSGSTGSPKTISLSKQFVAASARRTISYFGLARRDRVLHCLPHGYIAGKLMTIRALTGGLDLHIVDPSGDFRVLDDTCFAFAAMTPNQVAKILDRQDGERRLLNIGSLLIGGDGIPPRLEERLRNTGTPCYLGYGMTETATHIAIRRINGAEADLFYNCLEGISVELSENGCLKIFMDGVGADGLETTDLAEVIDNKSFRISGRADNIIISGGLKFSPEQIEQRLEGLITGPFMISSLPHDTLGRQIILIVEGRHDTLMADDLMALCRRCLGKYERPRLIHFVDTLPRTSTGKLLRRVGD